MCKAYLNEKLNKNTYLNSFDIGCVILKLTEEEQAVLMCGRLL